MSRRRLHGYLAPKDEGLSNRPPFQEQTQKIKICTNLAYLFKS